MSVLVINPASLPVPVSLAGGTGALTVVPKTIPLSSTGYGTPAMVIPVMTTGSPNLAEPTTMMFSLSLVDTAPYVIAQTNTSLTTPSQWNLAGYTAYPVYMRVRARVQLLPLATTYPAGASAVVGVTLGLIGTSGSIPAYTAADMSVTTAPVTFKRPGNGPGSVPGGFTNVATVRVFSALKPVDETTIDDIVQVPWALPSYSVVFLACYSAGATTGLFRVNAHVEITPLPLNLLQP